MSDEVLRKVDVDWLLSIYGALLTDKQRTMAALYYDEDLSLAEIAQQETSAVNVCMKRCSVWSASFAAGKKSSPSAGGLPRLKMN